MTEPIVEIHVPLTPSADVAPGEYPFPWIDDIEETLEVGAEDGRYEMYDDGEELGDEYVFFIVGDDEKVAARRGDGRRHAARRAGRRVRRRDGRGPAGAGDRPPRRPAQL